jgi:hypothetical protein
VDEVHEGQSRVLVLRVSRESAKTALLDYVVERAFAGLQQRCSSPGQEPLERLRSA